MGSSTTIFSEPLFSWPIESPASRWLQGSQGTAIIRCLANLHECLWFLKERMEENVLFPWAVSVCSGPALPRLLKRSVTAACVTQCPRRTLPGETLACLLQAGLGVPATAYCAFPISIPPPAQLVVSAAHNGNPWFLFLFLTRTWFSEATLRASYA